MLEILLIIVVILLLTGGGFGSRRRGRRTQAQGPQMSASHVIRGQETL
jgi:hypothetical protein